MRPVYLAALVLSLLVASEARGEAPCDRECRCMAQALYFEARGEGWRGQLAVASVILNRVRDRRFPGTPCRVVRHSKRRGLHRCQFSFWCDGKSERTRDDVAWSMAQNLAATALASGLRVRGLERATHYHAARVRPYWSRSLREVGRIGRHIFYEPVRSSWAN